MAPLREWHTNCTPQQVPAKSVNQNYGIRPSRGRPAPGIRWDLVVGSLLLHVTVLVGAQLLLSSEMQTAKLPLLVKVQSSLFSTEGAVTSVPTVVPVVNAEDPEPATMDSALVDTLPLADMWPLLPPPADTKRHDAQWKQPLVRLQKSDASPLAAEVEPQEAATSLEVQSAAGALASAEVPVPVPGNCPAPDYPKRARMRRQQGVVLVLFEVADDGSCSACRISKSSGYRDLDEAALAAAREWRFTGGPGKAEVPFVFRLEGS